MIVTIVHQSGEHRCRALAPSLARLRSHSGRTVLLLDLQLPQSPPPRARRMDADDIVVDVAGVDSPACRQALIAAQVTVVALAPNAAPAACSRLAARLRDTPMFNPGMRLLLACPAVADADGDAMLRLLGNADIRRGAPAVFASLVRLPCSGADPVGADQITPLYHGVYAAPGHF